MDLNVTLTITLVLSLVVLVATVVTALFFYRRTKSKGLLKVGRSGDSIGQRERILTPLQIIIFGVFVAATIAFYPLYYVDFLSGDNGFVRVVKAILLAMQNVLRLFTLNGEFDNVRELLSDPERVKFALGQAYTVYMSVIFVAAPILTATFVLSFFKEAASLLRVRLSVVKRIYYMSELNERSVTLAEDILSYNSDEEYEVKGKEGVERKVYEGKRRVVFTDVYRKAGEERYEELMEKAKRLGAVLVRRDITKLHFSNAHKVVRKLYFIGENEDENLRQALTVIGQCREDKKYNNPDTRLYVFATNAESETLLDSADNGAMTVRRINENRDLVIETFRTCDLFGGDAPIVREKLEALRQKICAEQFDAQCKSQKYKVVIEPVTQRELHFVIVGLGGYGTEMLKSLCWYCQVPGYKPVIDVFDKEDDAEDMFMSVAPELLTTRNAEEDDEAKYDIIFHSGVNVKREKFLKDVETIDKANAIDGVFVTLGDDELNIETALRIRVRLLQSKFRLEKGQNASEMYRKLKSMDKKQRAAYLDMVATKPDIYAVVFSDSKSRSVVSGLKNRSNENYHIKFIGSMQSRYTLEAIERSELEESGFKLHNAWSLKNSKTQKEREEAFKRDKDSYNKYEYFRRSSMARAVYLENLHKFGYIETEHPECDFDDALNDMLKQNEHLRWNAYMRSEGYCKGVIKYDLGKLHDELLTYEELKNLESTKGKLVTQIEIDKDSAFVGEHGKKAEE